MDTKNGSKKPGGSAGGAALELRLMAEAARRLALPGHDPQRITALDLAGFLGGDTVPIAALPPEVAQPWRNHRLGAAPVGMDPSTYLKECGGPFLATLPDGGKSLLVDPRVEIERWFGLLSLSGSRADRAGWVIADPTDRRWWADDNPYWLKLYEEYFGPEVFQIGIPIRSALERLQGHRLYSPAWLGEGISAVVHFRQLLKPGQSWVMLGSSRVARDGQREFPAIRLTRSGKALELFVVRDCDEAVKGRVPLVVSR